MIFRPAKQWTTQACAVPLHQTRSSLRLEPSLFLTYRHLPSLGHQFMHFVFNGAVRVTSISSVPPLGLGLMCMTTLCYLTLSVSTPECYLTLSVSTPECYQHNCVLPYSYSHHTCVLPYTFSHHTCVLPYSFTQHTLCHLPVLFQSSHSVLPCYVITLLCCHILSVTPLCHLIMLFQSLRLCATSLFL